MEKRKAEELIGSKTYPGRGIVIGRSDCGRYAVTAYFIMGRSTNSRNRVFVTCGEGIRTQAYDISLLQDPSLIIYAPVRVLDSYTIVTNGDQTDTVYDGLAKGLSFEEALASRVYEPDAPNYTPRISGLLDVRGGFFCYKLSILKKEEDTGDGECCCRHTYSYTGTNPGEGRFLSTYVDDGSPLPSFEGEPVRIALEGGIDEFTEKLWNSLNEDNRVSLFTRYIRLEDGKTETRIVNRHQ